MKTLPPADDMYKAVIDRDTSMDGVFVLGVRTTGIFCRPGCGAKKPRRENVEFFATSRDALHAGYRPCLRCRPLSPGETPPEWIRRALDVADRAADRRVRTGDLRDAGLDPARVSRYFKAHYGMTFLAYHRARRVGSALRVIREGRTVAGSAARSGFESESGLRDAFVRLFGDPPTRARTADAGLLAARWLATPLGPMLAIAGDRGLSLLEFIDRRALPAQIESLRKRIPGAVVPGDHPTLDALARQLDEYFAGTRATFDVPIDRAGTPFQMAVWDVLLKIPAGVTRSYLEVARAIGRPSAVRAVARANGDNRIAILIPCHRVIGADGSPTGYGGGLWRKNWLLEHEREMPAGDAPSGLFLPIARSRRAVRAGV